MRKFNVKNIKLSPFNKILLFILFLLICAIIPIFYSTQGVTDPYSFEHIAYVEKYQNSTHLPLEDNQLSIKNIQGAITEILIISKITNISPKIIQFLPIIGLILPIVYYSLCKKFSNSIISIFFITIMMLNIPEPMTFFTIWPHAFGFLLYLIFILISIHIFKKKEMRFIIILLIIFVSIHFYSYTSEAWVVSFFLIINLLLLLSIYVFKNKQLKNKLMLNYSLLFIVLFFAFTNIFYESYLSKGNFLENILTSFKNFINYYGNFFSFPETEKYAYRADPNIIISVLGLIYLALLILILFFYFIKYFINSLNNKSKNIYNNKNLNFYLIFSLVIVGFIDMIIYSARGVIPWRYIYFIFPLLVLVSINKITYKKIYKICILFFLVIVISSHSYLSWENNKVISNPSKYSDIETSASWFFYHSIENNALIDLRTGNKYLLESVIMHKNFIKHEFFSDQYTLLLDSNYTLIKNNLLRNIAPYIIINQNLIRIESYEWGFFEPFYKYKNEINKNININKIYDDNKIWIFAT